MLFRIKRMLNGVLNDKLALPGVLIIGAQKAGTTSLFHYLMFHSQIKYGKKEINFFNLKFKKGKTFYKNCFPIGIGVAVDGSPNYLYHQEAAENASKVLLPNTKFIVILRDPVNRAFSAWNMYRQLVKDEKSKSSFHQIEKQNPKLRLYSEYCNSEFPSFSECIRKELKWIEEDRPILEPSLIRRGFYQEQIERWQHFFPKENFFFIRSKDLIKEDHAKAVLSDLEIFLNINQGELQQINFSLKHSRKYNTSIPTDLELKLRKIFIQKNEGLEKLTGLTFTWKNLPVQT